MDALLPIVVLGMPAFLFAQAAAAPTDGLLQYGAIGLLALLALYAVNKLFARQVSAHDKDIARADRLENELRQQNRVIQDRLVVELTRAAEVMSAFLAQQQQQQQKEKK